MKHLKNLRKRLVAISVLVAVVNLSGLAFAQPVDLSYSANNHTQIHNKTTQIGATAVTSTIPKVSTSAKTTPAALAVNENPNVSDHIQPATTPISTDPPHVTNDTYGGSSVPPANSSSETPPIGNTPPTTPPPPASTGCPACGGIPITANGHYACPMYYCAE